MTLIKNNVTVEKCKVQNLASTYHKLWHTEMKIEHLSITRLQFCPYSMVHRVYIYVIPMHIHEQWR